jgi:hypothetical protein
MPATFPSCPQQKSFYFNVKNRVKFIFYYFDVINLLSGHKYAMLDMNREGNDYAEANAEKARPLSESDDCISRHRDDKSHNRYTALWEIQPHETDGPAFA